MQHPYTWKDTGDAAQRVNWRIEDVIGDGAGLDLARSFLPESLARTGGLGFLSDAERRAPNPIRGHAYLSNGDRKRTATDAYRNTPALDGSNDHTA
jgi:hypothetical protein